MPTHPSSGLGDGLGGVAQSESRNSRTDGASRLTGKDDALGGADDIGLGDDDVTSLPAATA
jgi:hypothetical protein